MSTHRLPPPRSGLDRHPVPTHRMPRTPAASNHRLLAIQLQDRPPRLSSINPRHQSVAPGSTARATCDEPGSAASGLA